MNATIVDKFADIRVLRYDVPGFEKLPLSQKKLLFYLSEAALWGRDIFWHQNGAEGLLLRKVLECIYQWQQKQDTLNDALSTFTKRVWFANGIHHHYSNDKFAPNFTESELLQWMLSVPTDIFLSAVGTTPHDALNQLRPLLFDATYKAKKVSLRTGEDLVATSAVNFYSGVTQNEVEQLYATTGRNALNSQVSKLPDGTITENVWRLGGMYSSAIQKIIYWLNKAADVATDASQANVIRLLIKYYQTGKLADFDAFSIEWVKQKGSLVDFINGFIEVYNDPLGLKATWESIVELTNVEASAQIELISANAQWFEDHSPIAPEWRKKEVKGVSMNVISAVMLGGDCYPATPIGVNLPNADWIREQYGSKSISLANITHAYHAAGKGSGVLREFAFSPEEIERQEKYGAQADELHTQLHECLGHGSGQMADGVTLDNLKAYGSTIEEARADLFALYFMADDKMQEIGVLPSKEGAWAHYEAYMRGGLLVQMSRIEEGCDIEEAHMRNRQMICKWVIEKAEPIGAAAMIEKDGKHYVVINNYEALRTLFGNLLAEVQRIKSMGDYEAARNMVETYGVKIDKTLHHEVRKRYAALNVPPFSGFVNPKLEPIMNNGDITDIEISYTEMFDEQMLRYSHQYSVLN